MPAQRSTALVGAAVLALIAVLALLYAGTRGGGGDSYFQNMEILSEIKQLDEEWELEVLKSKIGIVKGYATVVDARDRVIQRIQDFEARIDARSRDGADLARRRVDALRTSIAEKDAMVDEFKLHNGLMQEALKNLPMLAHDVEHALRATTSAHLLELKALAQLVDELYLVSFAYDRGGMRAVSTELPMKLAQWLPDSRYQALPDGARHKVDDFNVHVRMLLGERDLVNELLGKIVTAPTNVRVNQIRYAMNEEQARVVERSQQFRIYLLAFSVLLLGLLVYAAVRVVRGHALVRRMNAELVQANENLELRVQERTRALQEAQGGLMASARQAGMAEIATNVLHNVGNVLNSVNVSTQLLIGKVRASRVQGLGQATKMLAEHRGSLGEFLESDPKGKLLPGYLEQLAQAMAAERDSLAQELVALASSVDHIKEVIATQQGIAGASSVVTPVSVQALVEDALRMAAESLQRHRISVVRDFSPVPELLLDKARILQILVNLVTNAKQALSGISGREPCIQVGIAITLQGALRISVTDNGQGIAAEHLQRIFSHGFTTKPQGHGFGLHGAAIAAREMGGSLQVHSDGLGQGATFTLEIAMGVRNG